MATKRCKWVRLKEESVHFRSGIFIFKFEPHPLAAITSGIIRVHRVAGGTLLSYQLSFTELVLYSAGLLTFWALTEAMIGRLRIELFQTALWVFVLFLIGNVSLAIWWFRRFLRNVAAPGHS